MKSFYFFISILCFEVMLGQSPITLNNGNMPNSGDTLRVTNVSINSLGNYTQTGTNNVWNFSTVNSLSSEVREFRPITSTPYALFFFSFTGFAEKIPDFNVNGFGFTNSFSFFRKQSNPINAFVADGVGMTFSNVPLPSYYTDRDELYVFPLTYPKRDSTTFRFATPSTALVPIRYIKTGYRITEVDGWGTITTPFGTENCIRLITTQYAQDSIKNNFLPFPFGVANVQRSYQWMTLNSKIPYFEVSGQMLGNNFTPVSARYRGYKIEKVEDTVNTTGIINHSLLKNLVIYPNPVKDKIKIEGLSENTDVEIYDAAGKILMMKKNDSQGSNFEIDVKQLPQGIYFLRVSEGQEQRHLKFVRE